MMYVSVISIPAKRKVLHIHEWEDVMSTRAARVVFEDHVRLRLLCQVERNQPNGSS